MRQRNVPALRRALAVGLGATMSLVACRDEQRTTFRPLQAGDPAPAYAAPVLDGDSLDLADLHGSAVLLNIWATWCPPCREEMPGLQELHARYARRGLRVLGVSIDSPGSERAVRDFAAEYGLDFTVLFDPADLVTRRFRANGVPETFLIDREGRLVHRWIGRFDPLADDVIRRVEAVLGDGDPVLDADDNISG